MSSRKPLLMLALLGLTLLLASCRGNPTTVLERLEASRRSVTNLRIEFRHVADASNRAVMADTEEGSKAAAQEWRQAKRAVEKHAAELTPLLSGLSYAAEARILGEFEARFAEYQKLDERIVSLAVENTNLQAQALSLGAAAQAANAIASSLDRARSHLLVKDVARAELLAGQVMLAVREIQVLHAPHIAERDEPAMSALEKRMTHLDAKARAALASLSELATLEAQPQLAEALAALDRFERTSAQIIELSRRNTNLLSLDLALREKPALVAACNERLVALQAALAQEGPKSTR